MEEIWKDIQGFNYSISSLGRVKSNKSGRILKPWRLRQGYLQVGLMAGGKRFRFLVHRLVAEAFLSKKDYQTDVNHIDLNKFNNTVGNLEWASKEENMQHAVRMGVISSNSQRYSKDFIKEALSYGGGTLETCRVFDIHPSTFWRWRKKSQELKKV